MKALLLVAAALIASPANAATLYGIEGGCENARALATGEGPTIFTDRWMAFDGKQLLRHETTCDLAGNCWGEAETWREKITVVETPEAVTVTIDGRTETLTRCE